MIAIGFVGAGLIGQERIRAATALIRAGYKLRPTVVVDPHAPAAPDLAAALGARFHPHIDGLLADAPDWVCVSTPHDTAVELVPRLLAAGVKVLIEKPLGRNLKEAEALAAGAAPGALWVGQNYRFYRGIAALVADLKAGWFGPPTSMSMILGHGGGPKDIGTWKLDPVRAGGGVIIDPGIHLIDIVNLVESKPPQVAGGTTWSGFWKTGIEEEIHVLLQGEAVPVYDLTVSLVRWRSMCRLEVHGLEGYGIVEGRGRSYGVQRYRRGRRWAWQQHTSQSDSEEIVVETDGADVFFEEMRALLFNDATLPARPCSLAEALANMRLLDTVRTALSLPIP